MASHFILAIGIAGLFALCIGIILSSMREAHAENLRLLKMANLTLAIHEIAKAGVASAEASRPVVPIRRPAALPRPVLLLPPPSRVA